MIKNKKMAPKSDDKKLKIKVIAIFASVVLLLYIIGLVNPVTSMQFQYPYYELFCGKKPVIAHTFMVHSYYTPDQKKYQDMLGVDGKLFCTEVDAQKAGYQKSPSP